MTRIVLAGIATLGSTAAVAVEAVRPFAAPESAGRAADGTTGHLLQMILALCVVLAFVAALAWFSRRIRAAVRPGGLSVEILAQAALGPKERAVVVKVGADTLLLGVAPGSVTMLHVVPTTSADLAGGNDAPAAPKDGAPRFADLLRRSLGQS